jgi:uncharacterized protein YbaP (TraB family)
MRIFHAVLVVGLSFTWQHARGQVSGAVQAASPALQEFAEIVVTGEQPGPALWRVQSGDHVLWLLGGVSQLPGRVTWRSKQLETVLVTSQELIVDGVTSAARSKRERAALKRETKLPDGKTLKAVLSPELYERVEAARRSFASGDSDFERLRPFHAGNRIVMGSMKALGLTPFGARHVVVDLATKARVPVTHIADTEGIQPALMLPETEAPTTPCLEAAAAILEDGGSGVRALANAWALGDITALRKLVPLYDLGDMNARMAECSTALAGKDQSRRAMASRHAGKWLDAAQRSLATNKSTVAVVSMSELLSPDGYLAALRASGYEIIEPR